MTVGVPGFVGARLAEARRARGMSAVDLASMVDVSAQSISKYENDHQSPRIETINSIARTLKMPQPYFFRPMHASDTKPVFWRSKLSVPTYARDRVAVRLEWVKDLVDYVGEFFNFPDLQLPDVGSVDVEKLDEDALRQIADDVRTHWGVRSGPLPNVIKKLEMDGLFISRITMGVDKLDAFSQWSDRFGFPVMVLSRDKASAVRQRFDALHEYAHILLHKYVTTKTMNNPARYKEIEKQADTLAGFLLLPEQDFAEELFAPTLDGFVMMKERWGASVGAMIMRCRAMDILDDRAARTMWINYNRRGWRKSEPLDSSMPIEQPTLLRRSIEKLVEAGVQTPQDIQQSLALPAKEIEDIADLRRGFLGGVLDADEQLEPVFKSSVATGDNVVRIFKDR